MKTITLYLLLLLMLLGCVACENNDDDHKQTPSPDPDDDDDDDNDDDNNDNDNDDDTPFSSISLIEPLNWKRYSCDEQTKSGKTIVTGSYNIHGGKEATPTQIGQALKDYGPYDVFTLQECPEEYAQPIAQEMGMEYFFSDGQSLMSSTPLVNPQRHFFDVGTGGKFLHATTIIDGTEFSVYGVHVTWDQNGDLENRKLVDDYLAVDPVDRVVLMGDWNEELGSTQVTILEEQAADAWSSLGVPPSTRTTWPAIMFYGAEGMQLIDNTYFNKSSGACAVEGEILHLNPNMSDHKPQRSTIFFPDLPQFSAPILLDIIYGFGPDTLGFLFDKPLKQGEVEITFDGSQISIQDQAIIGDGTILLVQMSEPLPVGNEVAAKITDAVDIDDAQIAAPITITVPIYENLIQNPGAESSDEGWEFFAMETSTENHFVTPLVNDYFFTGTGQNPRAYASQDIPLDSYSDVIDAGFGWLSFGGACRTGYRLVDGGTSNLLLPHDECEGMVELLDADGELLGHVTGGRFDPLYWQPWRVTEPIPPKTRIARVTLRAAAAEQPLIANTASFDALNLSVMTGESPHNLAGGNLVVNPLFESGNQDWNFPQLTILAKDHWIPIRSNIDIISATGNYLVTALMLTPGEKTISQTIFLAEYTDLISTGQLDVEWGSYLRTWNPRTEISLHLTFLGGDAQVTGSDQIGPVNIPEWFIYSKTAPIPPGTVEAKLEWVASSDTAIIGVGCFFDAPFVYPVLVD